MKTEYESNKENAETLSKLILEHPNLRVVAWIDSDGIEDDYAYYAGKIYKPKIETIVEGKTDGAYHSKEDDVYEDCYNYYGCECDNWSDEELEDKAKAIPWEDVIAVSVSVA